jgi:osmotically-inducible protein OsmY
MPGKFFAPCCFAVLCGVTPAGAQIDRVPADAGALGRTVRESPHVTIFDDVEVRVDGPAVVLEGKVTTPAKKRKLEQQLRVDGVREVRNELRVLPPLSSDDELRHRVARAIYGNPAFWSYAALPNPPIHIIVERGTVTLRGTVASQVERTMARSLASGLGELSVVNELQTGVK